MTRRAAHPAQPAKRMKDAHDIRKLRNDSPGPVGSPWAGPTGPSSQDRPKDTSAYAIEIVREFALVGQLGRMGRAGNPSSTSSNPKEQD